MKKVAQRKCRFCGIDLPGTERRWEHHLPGQLRVDVYCEACMLEEVNDYAQRTIMGMLDGEVEVRINGEAIRVLGAKVIGKQAVQSEGTEP